MSSIDLTSCAERAASFLLVGIANMLASIEPYIVVIKATAIPGPSALTSARFPNIAMSPINVPIIPNDGPNSAILSNTVLLALCLSSKFPISVSRIALTSSGSVPSTTN